MSQATFQNAIDLYVFDKQLRILVLDALERIEISLRVDIAYTLGKSDPFTYYAPTYFMKILAKKLTLKQG